MWAMMPMLRVRSSERSEDMTVPALPAVMGVRAIRVRHAMRLFALAHRLAALRGGVEELGRELLFHGLARARARRVHHPAHRERRASVGRDLDRDLIGRAADAPALDLDARAHVVDRAPEQAHGLFLAALLHQLERAVGDSLGDALLAA